MDDETRKIDFPQFLDTFTRLPVELRQLCYPVFDLKISDEQKAQLVFWVIWEWTKKQEWWEDFLDTEDITNSSFTLADLYEVVNPIRFPELIATYLRERRTVNQPAPDGQRGGPHE